jgi:hypothetical protein
MFLEAIFVHDFGFFLEFQQQTSGNGQVFA